MNLRKARLELDEWVPKLCLPAGLISMIYGLAFLYIGVAGRRWDFLLMAIIAISCSILIFRYISKNKKMFEKQYGKW